MLTALVASVALLSAPPVWDPASTWTVTAGVLRWKDKDLDSFSAYHRKDKELDKTLGARGVPPAQRVLLLDRQATSEAVLAAVAAEVAKAPAGSTFIFYFTGHGVRDDAGGLVLATTDTDTAHLDHTGLHARDLVPIFALRSARDRVILLSDACTSGDLGAVAVALSHLGVPTASLTSAASQTASTSNWTFTQTLIDALRGRAMIDANHDGELTLGEVAAEARAAMKYREGQPIGLAVAGVDPGLVLADAAPWPVDLAALDAAGALYHRGDWVIGRKPDGARAVGRVLGVDHRGHGKGAAARLRLAFYGYADETLGWTREDKVQPIFFESWPVGTHLEVEDDGDNYEAIVLESVDGLHRVHYEGFGNDEDEWVTPDQILRPWQVAGDDPRNVVVDGSPAWVKSERGGRVCVRYPGSDWTEDECVPADRVEHVEATKTTE